MKKLKMFWGLMAISISVFAFVSCDKNDDPAPVPLTGVVDVVIKDMKTDAGVKYGLFVYISSNKEIKSAKVTAPGTGGKIYQLTSTSDKKKFEFIPQTVDYAATIPTEGNYSFEIIDSNDAKITGHDAVGDEKLDPLTIKTATMASHKLNVTWDKVTGTDYYSIRILKADKSEVLFSVSNLASTLAEYEISATTSGWAAGKSPVVNTNYVVELIGTRVETGATTDKENNLQFVTSDTKTFKWE